MHVWISWCKRKCECSHCKETILCSEPMVSGRHTTTKGGRKWTIKLHWHPQCWVGQGLAYLQSHPMIKGPGRPRIMLSEEDKAARHRLLLKHGNIRHRQKVAALAGDAVRVLDLEIRRQEVIEEMSKYGPIPRSWRVNEIQGIPT